MTMQSRLTTFVCGSVLLAMMLGTAGCSCIRGPWIVGKWKAEALGMEVQYEFKKNGTVTIRREDGDSAELGKWRLDGNKLIMTNEDDKELKFLISDKSSKSFTATIVGTPMVLEFTRK